MDRTENFNSGFTTKLIDRTNKFYQVALKQFKFQKKLQGITVNVQRVKQDSKYRRVLGSLYNSNNIDDQEVEEFSYVVLIQINDIKKLFLKQIDQIDFYDNEDKIQKGDTLIYSHGDQRFQMKVSEVENFSDVKGILYHYTLTGSREIKIL